MDKEKAEFAARLRAALEAKGIEASAAVIEKRFNSRYGGAAVTAQAISGWLNGKSMPKQDKIRVLAAIVGMEPHELQFGGKGLYLMARKIDDAGLNLRDQLLATIGRYPKDA
jgi:transcriptional regulator with XRE-family HTH domain